MVAADPPGLGSEQVEKPGAGPRSPSALGLFDGLLEAEQPVLGPYQGTKTIRGEDWQPYQQANFVTPPFAECLLGHSTFSGAAAALLKLALGSDTFGMSVTIPAGSSPVEPGAVPAAPVTLSWKSFGAAADQAGISREYGGIHFKDGDFEARQAGDLVGQQVWAKVKHYFDGKATATT